MRANRLASIEPRWADNGAADATGESDEGSPLLPRRVPVRAMLWGETETAQERALDYAQRSPWRKSWDFVEVERRTGETCPLKLKDPKALAAEQGYGWAYVVYRVGGAR